MNVYEIVTDRIIKELENGTIPWHRPWGLEGYPVNFATKKEYRGINVFLLAMARRSTPFFLTLKQANELGGSVKTGEKGFPVVFFKWLETTKTDGSVEEFPLLRYYTVFNLDQIKGIEIPCLNRKPIEPIADAEKIVANMPNCPTIEHSEPRAYYRPITDKINMPTRNSFENPLGYYATLFHELTHSTGHASRLNRHKDEKADCNFGSPNYAREELVAEMGCAFLLASAGIDSIDETKNNAAYIASWLKVLRSDKRLVVTAAAQAQKASDFILDKKPTGGAKQ